MKKKSRECLIRLALKWSSLKFNPLNKGDEEKKTR